MTIFTIGQTVTPANIDDHRQGTVCELLHYGDDLVRVRVQWSDKRTWFKPSALIKVGA